MSIFQFLRILWAHRWVTVMTTIFTLAGALVAILIIPPRYQAVSRVMLNTLKPDPVTGEVISSSLTRTYITTQTELIKDYVVAGKAVDQLNWAASPELNAQYESSNRNGMDIRRWLAQRIIAGTNAKVVGGTNILEISYGGSTPNEAKAMADALRNAYIDSTLDSRREEATRTANWYQVQAQKELALLNAADAAKTAFERENDIVMSADNIDLETSRLRALATQVPAAAAPMAGVMAAPSSAQLAQLDAAIAQAGQNLGPNHPQMMQLRAQRAAVAQQVSQEMAAARAAASGGQSATTLQREVASQASKVLAKRDQIERLNQLQSDVNLRRDQYNKSMSRIAELRQEAGIADTGLLPLGEAVTPRSPSFPNKPLILGGALGFGFGMGILLSLLLELFGRRVRSAEDLRTSLDVPLLGIIQGPPSVGVQKKRGFKLQLWARA